MSDSRSSQVNGHTGKGKIVKKKDAENKHGDKHHELSMVMHTHYIRKTLEEKGGQSLRTLLTAIPHPGTMATVDTFSVQR